MRKTPKFPGTLICASCNKECPRTGPVQKYCRECSVAKDIYRKAKWARENPQKPAPLDPEKTRMERERLKSRGAEVSLTERESISWNASVPVDLQWMVRTSVPHSYSLSKNAIHSMGKGGSHIFLRDKARAVRNELVMKMKLLVRNQEIFRGKIWIDIMVQKPDNRGDAINFVDSICDAVKVAIGVDDRFFAIRRLDWQVTKVNPRIFVGVGQDITEHHKLCSYCGRLVPDTNISAHRRICKTCRHVNEFEKYVKETKNG